MKKINGLLNNDFLHNVYSDRFPNEMNYIDYISNCSTLEGVLACAGLFSPEFIEHEGAVYLSSNIEGDITNIRTWQSPNSSSMLCKKELEQYNNLLCLYDLFQLEYDNCGNRNSTLLLQLAKALIYYWSARLNVVFPERKFDFILSTSGLYDEDGLCITFYEV